MLAVVVVVKSLLVLRDLNSNKIRREGGQGIYVCMYVCMYIHTYVCDGAQSSMGREGGLVDGECI